MAFDMELKRTKCIVSRKLGESVHVGEARITIEKKKRSQNSFLLIIEAPADVPIAREEVLEKYPTQKKPSIE